VDLFRKEGIGTLAFIPLTTHEGVVGKLMLYESRPGALTPEKLGAARSVGAYLGLAVERLVAWERQAAAHAEAERLAQAIDAHTDAVYLTDASGAITRVNAAFERMSGFASREAVGRSPAILKSERTSEEVHRDLWETVRSGRPWSGRLCNRRNGTGQEYWVETSITPIRLVSGAVDGFVAVQRDVTRQVLEEEHERVVHEGTQARVRVAAALAGPGTLADRADAVLMAVEWMGWLGQVRGSAVMLTPPGGGPPEVLCAHGTAGSATAVEGLTQEALRTGSVVVGRGEGGSRVYAVPLVTRTGGAPGEGPAGRVGSVGVLHLEASGAGGATDQSLGVLREIAEQITTAVLQDRAARMAEDARARAEEASRAKSEFLANMSHEIRTPMTAILGYTDLLADEGDRTFDPGQRREYIDTIRRNGEHLLALINGILDLSKIEAGKMGVERIEMSPCQVLEDVEALMRVKAMDKGITLSLVRETAIPSVIRSDPVRVRQVVMNLVGNAVKFTEAGQVRIRAALEDGGGSGPFLRVRVEDSGIGMTPDQVERLFEAFAQADASTTRRFGGTGLGLRISRSLVGLLGGDISVASEPGRGSAFTARIPTGPLDGVAMVAPGDQPHAVRASAPAAPTGGELAGVRVFLAEDGADNQRLITFHLRKAGAEVTVFAHGLAALEAMTVDGTADGALMDPPACDVVVTDMQMPEMDGYTFATLLRRKGWSRRIIALTAHAMTGDEERCLAAGCDAYASKPIDRARLVEVCRPAAAAPPG
jgi:PAS domain S-box-containing protein